MIWAKRLKLHNPSKKLTDFLYVIKDNCVMGNSDVWIRQCHFWLIRSIRLESSAKIANIIRINELFLYSFHFQINVQTPWTIFVLFFFVSFLIFFYSSFHGVMFYSSSLVLVVSLFLPLSSCKNSTLSFYNVCFLFVLVFFSVEAKLEMMMMNSVVAANWDALQRIIIFSLTRLQINILQLATFIRMLYWLCTFQFRLVHLITFLYILCFFRSRFIYRKKTIFAFNQLTAP